MLKMNYIKKSLKAFLKLKKDLLSLNPNIRTSMHMFDHTIKPILLHVCRPYISIYIGSTHVDY
jgi:hypothetical protein